MQFGIFYEHQIPRPWNEGDEHQLLQDALDQVELADQIGIDYVWEVEHHFLEEYSHSSAPEVFLAACSQRTQRIKLGHGIVLMPPGYNHPARVAERIATLDLVSNGRVQWGTGKSSSRIELEGFGIDPQQRHEMWLETVHETAKMMCSSPYPGYEGEFFSMPMRNVVPKPMQKPHPPLWVACSNRETIKESARLGMGALCFAFLDGDEARQWVNEYYTTFKNECQPIGQAVNPNIAMVASFMCHEDSQLAVDRGLEGFQFFGYALSHYYITGTHEPGRFDIWEDFQQNRPPQREPVGCIGNPAQVRAHLAMLEEAGVDQVIFVQQAGNNRQEHILESLRIFGEQILPEFKERDPAYLNRKAEELAPHIERATSQIAPSPEPDEVGSVDSYPVLAQKMTTEAGANSENDRDPHSGPSQAGDSVTEESQSIESQNGHVEEDPGIEATILGARIH
ncbi:MAG: LLM class flavin-dependent oxidoreductase [Chloroflexota bacterium]